MPTEVGCKNTPSPRRSATCHSTRHELPLCICWPLPPQERPNSYGKVCDPECRLSDADEPQQGPNPTDDPTDGFALPPRPDEVCVRGGLECSLCRACDALWRTGRDGRYQQQGDERFVVGVRPGGDGGVEKRLDRRCIRRFGAVCSSREQDAVCPCWRAVCPESSVSWRHDLNLMQDSRILVDFSQHELVAALELEKVPFSEPVY